MWNKKIVWLRAVAGFSLIVMTIGFGIAGSHMTIVANLGLVFSLTYIFDKWTLWKLAFKTETTIQLFKRLLTTALVQIVVCALFYLIGRGIGHILKIEIHQNQEAQENYILMGVLLLNLILSYLIKKHEFKTTLPQTTSTSLSSKPRTWHMIFNPEPISIENFYTDFYHRQPDELRYPSAEKIQEFERKLNLEFPPLLKSLYLKQNGGYCSDLWVPAKSEPTDLLDDWRAVFSHDYCYLLPLEKLGTVYDSYRDFLTEAQIAEDPQIPKNAKKYLILCQRYLDTTFLDYSQPGEPRVGVVDFDGIDKKDVWFENFEEFFKYLRRADIEER
jgi:hypothetical protein